MKFNDPGTIKNEQLDICNFKNPLRTHNSIKYSKKLKYRLIYFKFSKTASKILKIAIKFLKIAIRFNKITINY